MMASYLSTMPSIVWNLDNIYSDIVLSFDYAGFGRLSFAEFDLSFDLLEDLPSEYLCFWSNPDL